MSSKVDAEVKQLNTKLVKAYLQNDTAISQRIFADLSQTQNLPALNSGTKYEFDNSDNVDVRVNNNTAVVISNITRQNQVISDRLQYTRVFVKQQEQWKIVAMQVSKAS